MFAMLTNKEVIEIIRQEQESEKESLNLHGEGNKIAQQVSGTIDQILMKRE